MPTPHLRALLTRWLNAREQARSTYEDFVVAALAVPAEDVLGLHPTVPGVQHLLLARADLAVGPPAGDTYHSVCMLADGENTTCQESTLGMVVVSTNTSTRQRCSRCA